MVNKAMKMAVIIVITCIALSTSFWLGGYVASSRVDKLVNGIQSKITYRHLMEYEKISSDLKLDCVDQVQMRLEFLIKEQKMMLAEYTQSYDDYELEKYISLRSPGLMDELGQYEVDFEKKLNIPDCQKTAK